MEGFEHVCKVALEAEHFVVASNLKFPVPRKTRKKTHEVQTHGYEVDLVGARGDRLVLASVKSYFGSRGVSKEGFRGLSDKNRPSQFKRYVLFNDLDVQQGVITKAAKMFGYPESAVELRLYVGKFCGKEDERLITAHLMTEREGFRAVEVIGLRMILNFVREVASRKTYLNDPVVLLMKALELETRRSKKHQ